jgi:4-hydroxy-tetrahydrodipicolinate synthase
MSRTDRFFGVLSPVVTPFTRDLAPDTDRFIRHCEWLVSQNCGLAFFGTNSEANSLSLAEKTELLEALVDAGVDTARMMPGTGACAIPDTVALTKLAVARGCAGVLMLPPFYYKGVSDDGLYRYFAEVIERVGDAKLRIYLYHIPPVAQVGITLDLIERLIAAYPETVVGIKDSSGDWSNTAAMLDRGWPDFAVFSGNEKTLLDNLKGGGAGCISATANINPGAIAKLCEVWQTPEAEAMQADLLDLRLAVEKFPVIPSLKEVVAHYADDPEWARVRPPLDPLTGDQRAGLLAELRRRDFAMPGLVREPA